jgi:hypothetical protein
MLVRDWTDFKGCKTGERAFPVSNNVSEIVKMSKM